MTNKKRVYLRIKYYQHFPNSLDIFEGTEMDVLKDAQYWKNVQGLLNVR